MNMDLRIPVGSLFTILGLLLGGYGCVVAPAALRQSLGINIDLWWGGVLVLFGLFMLTMAWRASRQKPPKIP